MTEPFMLRAMMAGLALALVAAPLGCFVVWRRMAYFGETIAQGGLIGVALGLGLAVNVTFTVLGVSILLAFILLAMSRQSVVPLDSVLGVLAHAALAIGIVGASMVRGPSVDLMAILFGDIFAVTPNDLRWIAGVGALALAALLWIWRPLLSLSVHEDLAGAEGVPVERTKAIFVLVLAVVVAIALKVVGALLTIAFLIMPAAAARPFSETPEQMAFFAVIFATLAVAFGLFVSVSLDAPGGPSIVLVLSAMFTLAMLPVAFGRRRE
jgi:zinc transport system permease protein